MWHVGQAGCSREWWEWRINKVNIHHSILKLLTNRNRSHIEESNIQYIDIMVVVGQGRQEYCPKMALTPASPGNEIALFATG
jgi:hypothetical protein